MLKNKNRFNEFIKKPKENSDFLKQLTKENEEKTNV